MAQVKMRSVIDNNPYGIDKKTLVTGGCSFSVDGCWPTQLAYGLDMEYMIAGQSGAGNEFIMTATLFNISNSTSSKIALYQDDGETSSAATTVFNCQGTYYFKNVGGTSNGKWK